LLWHSNGMAAGVYDQQGQLTPKLIDGLYVEAMVLADEARSYFDTGGRDDRLALEPLDRVGFSCESLKVTTRLMHVIAWLLTQRAVAAGELNRAQAGVAERRLGPAADTDEALAARLPEATLDLIRASEELYGRVSRLDQGSFAENPAGSPARSLLSRLQRSF
jgi:regulator of CtrA degradation